MRRLSPCRAHNLIPDAWPSHKARVWHAGRPWPVGCNFVPSTAVNDTEMWLAETFDPDTIARELGWAKDIGFNSVRVFLQYVAWDADSDGFVDRLARFLEIAASRGISTMPVLFDDCAFSGKQPYLGAQDAPVSGVHNSSWVPSPGSAIASDRARWPRLEEYVRGVIGRFAADDRIIAWDLYNEPGNTDNSAGLGLLDAAFDWARRAEAQQPITAGVWRNTADRDWLDGDPLCRAMLSRSDVISFHCYGDLVAARKSVEVLESFGRPLACTEWFHRPYGSRIATHLPFWKRRGIGCYSWGLVAGRTQTYMPWDSAPGSPIPRDWQHDLLHKDGRPFDPGEIEAIRSASGRTRTDTDSHGRTRT